MWNAGLDDSQGVKIARKNINNFRYADNTTLMAESEEKLKSLLMKAKRESETAGLKLNIQNTKTMASSSITSLQIDGGKMETVADFIFLAPKSLQKVTSAMKLKDASCRKSYDKPRQCMKKQRHHFADKDLFLKFVLLTKTVKATVFPVVTYTCESWTIKKAKHQRTDASNELFWRRLLRVLWTSRRAHQ